MTGHVPCGTDITSPPSYPPLLTAFLRARRQTLQLWGQWKNYGYLSRLMKIKDRVGPSEQPSIVYRVQCKDSSSFNIKASLMTPQCVDTGCTFDDTDTKILIHTNSLTARLYKKATLINQYLINKCVDLPQAYSVLRAAIS